MELFLNLNSGEINTSKVVIKRNKTLPQITTKTGATSYIQGDDGATQYGRGVDYYTMSSNSPFGNINRFTNDLGGITLDGSDGSTASYIIDNEFGIGYSIIKFIGNISDAITASTTFALGAYNDFHVANYNEFINIREPSGGFKPNVLYFDDVVSWAVNTPYSPTLLFSSGSNGLPYVCSFTAVRNFLFCRKHIY